AGVHLAVFPAVSETSGTMRKLHFPLNKFSGSQMFVCSAIAEIFSRKSQLLRSTIDAHHMCPEGLCVCQTGAIPDEVLASHPNASCFPIKLVQVAKVGEDNITDEVIFYRHCRIIF